MNNNDIDDNLKRESKNRIMISVNKSLSPTTNTIQRLNKIRNENDKEVKLKSVVNRNSQILALKIGKNKRYSGVNIDESLKTDKIFSGEDGMIKPDYMSKKKV